GLIPPEIGVAALTRHEGLLSVGGRAPSRAANAYRSAPRNASDVPAGAARLTRRPRRKTHVGAGVARITVDCRACRAGATPPVTSAPPRVVWADRAAYHSEASSTKRRAQRETAVAWCRGLFPHSRGSREPAVFPSRGCAVAAQVRVVGRTCFTMLAGVRAVVFVQEYCAIGACLCES
ncbi:hypothetical protein TcCL_NonESM04899, partial [Trypanosoma cruzi]